MPAVELHAVSKSYSRRGRPPQKALDDLHLVVESGGVHGFLGPNGSGKTTTIRVLLGLVRADAGDVRLLDRPVPAGLPEVIGSVGALVETPLFFPGFSGRRNLRLLAETAGVPRGRVAEVLDVVALRDRADDLFKGYSLGMKQRLGIAAALLKRPRLLVLDEPSNGLDPAGIKDVRELIRRLGSDGSTTVLLSSHLLAEVEQVCSHVGIMSRGRLLAQGPLAELGAAGVATVTVRTTADCIPVAVGVLTSLGLAGVRPLASGGAETGAEAELADRAPEDVTAALVAAGVPVRGLAVTRPSLEDLFVQLTGEGFDVAR